MKIKFNVAYTDKIGQNKDFEFESGEKAANFLDKLEKEKQSIAINITGELADIKLGHSYDLYFDDHPRTVWSYEPDAPAWNRANFKALLRKEK